MIEVKHSLKNKPTLNLMYYHEHLPNPISQIVIIAGPTHLFKQGTSPVRDRALSLSKGGDHGVVFNRNKQAPVFHKVIFVAPQNIF